MVRSEGYSNSGMGDECAEGVLEASSRKVTGSEMADLWLFLRSRQAAGSQRTEPAPVLELGALASSLTPPWSHPVTNRYVSSP